MAKKAFIPKGHFFDWFPVSKSDTVNFVDDTTNNPTGYINCSAIYAAGAGNVVAVSAGGTLQTFALAAGEIKNISCIRINSTNTTATGIAALIASAAE